MRSRLAGYSVKRRSKDHAIRDAERAQGAAAARKISESGQVRRDDLAAAHGVQRQACCCYYHDTRSPAVDWAIRPKRPLLKSATA